MKTISNMVFITGLIGFTATASAQVFSSYANTSIPDGDENGYVFNLDVSGVATTLDTNKFKVNLVFEGDPIAGSGDLYAYLRSPDGKIAVLLNRPGVTLSDGIGYQDNGLNVTIYDGANDPNHKDATGTVQAFTDIHYYHDDPVYGSSVGEQGVTGIFKSDGRFIDPLDLQTSFATTTRDNTLQVFQGIDPNGTWNLFVADVASGGSSKLVSFGLDFTAIPEPQEYAMAIGLGLMGFALYRRRLLKNA